MKLLRLQFNTMQRLIHQRLLKPVYLERGMANRRDLILLARPDIETLLKSWDGWLPPEWATETYLGVHVKSLKRLAQLGLLVPQRGPKIDGYPINMYRVADLELLSERILQQAIPTAEPIPPSTLLAQFSTSYHAGTTLADAFLAILAGRIQLKSLPAQGPLCQRLVVLIPDPTLLPLYNAH